MKYLVTILIATLLYVIVLLLSSNAYIDKSTSVLLGYFSAYFPFTIYILFMNKNKKEEVV